MKRKGLILSVMGILVMLMTAAVLCTVFLPKTILSQIDSGEAEHVLIRHMKLDDSNQVAWEERELSADEFSALRNDLRGIRFRPYDQTAMTIPEFNLMIEYGNGDSICVDSVKIVKVCGDQTTKQNIYERSELEQIFMKYFD